MDTTKAIAALEEALAVWHNRDIDGEEQLRINCSKIQEAIGLIKKEN